MSKIIKIIMKNSRLRLCNLMMFYDVSLVRHQHLSYVAHCTQGTSHTDIRPWPFLSLCTNYKMVSNPVDYANACNQPSVFLAPSQGKSNLLWLLAETPLILEPLLIYGMQMHHLQSILRCEKVIGRPCVLPCNWMICINYYSLCSS